MSTRSRSSSFERAGAVLGDQHLVAIAPQHDRQQLPHRPLVVDDQDARADAAAVTGSSVWSSVVMFNSAYRRAHSSRRGSVTSTWVPTPRCERDVDLAAVVADDAMHDREAEPGALAKPPRNGWKMPSSSSGAMPTPWSSTRMTSSPGRLPPRSRRLTRQAQLAAVRHRAKPVGRQVPDDLPDLVLVGVVPGLGRRHVHVDLVRRRCSSALFSQQPRRVGDHLAHVDARRSRAAAAARRRGSCGWCRSSRSDSRSTMSISCACSAVSGSSCRRIWIEPDIEASGLRISCAMPAAISPTAASRCCTRASRSCLRASVTSWNVNRKPVSPRGVSSGAVLSPTRRPAVRPGGEPEVHSRQRRPILARAEQVAEVAAAAAGRPLAGWPTASDAVTPVIAVAARLNVSSRPSMSRRRQPARQAVDDVLAERLQVGDLVRRHRQLFVGAPQRLPPGSR